MKLSVDAGACTGHGRCYAVAPELLTADDDGFVTVRGTTIDVPVGSEAVARDAAGWCPEGAVHVRDD